MLRFLLALFVLGSFCVHAADGPQVPCDAAAAAAPAYAPLGQRPNWQSWQNVTIAAPCAPFANGKFGGAVALAGRFRDDGGGDAVLQRLGAISRATGIQYYSRTHRDSRQMIEKATALKSRDGKDTRGDFTPAEMKKGGELHYAWTDSATRRTLIYHMRSKVGPEARSIVVEAENLTALKVIVTLIPERALRWLHVLAQDSDGSWRYYCLALVTSSVDDDELASLENRALAVYRYVAGQPTAPAEPLAHR